MSFINFFEFPYQHAFDILDNTAYGNNGILDKYFFPNPKGFAAPTKMTLFNAFFCDSFIYG